jgi:hypothetical protein
MLLQSQQSELIICQPWFLLHFPAELTKASAQAPGQDATAHSRANSPKVRAPSAKIAA